MVQTLAASSRNNSNCSAKHSGHGLAYARREPEKTALYQVFHRHLHGFERMWKGGDDGGHLPKHVTDELRQYLTCGILTHGFAQMHCDSCHKRHLVAFSCKGRGFCRAQIGGFNLHAARRVAPNDKQGREILCRYILRPPLANERIRLMPDGSVTVEFKRPLSDGTRSIGLEPKALISRLAAIVPPPRRHVTVFSGVLASNSQWRRFVVPKPENVVRNGGVCSEVDAEARGVTRFPGSCDHPSAVNHLQPKPQATGHSKSRSGHYIPWHEFLRRTFGEEVRCPSCGGRLRLVAMVKTEAMVREILTAMHVPQSSTGPPNDEISQPSEPEAIELDWGDGGSGEANMCETVDWPEYPD